MPATRRAKRVRAATSSDGDAVLASLTKLRKAGRAGIPVTKLAVASGFDGGAGSLKAAIQDRLRAAGRVKLVDFVIEEERVGRGFRWRCGERIKEAIEALEDSA